MPQPSNLVSVTQKRYRCRHVHAAGHQCGSPALRAEEFCYFHHTTRRPKSLSGRFRHLDAQEPFELPLVEDLPSALSVAAQLLCRIASNDLDHARAGKLLYNLQIITSLIDRVSRTAAKTGAAPSPEPVTELVSDEAHGLIAPITEYVPAQPVPPAAAESNAPARPAAPPMPERDYTPEENEYFKYTVVARGYQPREQHPRPVSITDYDILAHTTAVRGRYSLPLLSPAKDATGRLIFFHELGPLFTIPAVAPQPEPDNPQPAIIPALQAAAYRQPWISPGPSVCHSRRESASPL